eukprot:1154090-Pelagomonas_calceolata.AAC.5
MLLTYIISNERRSYICPTHLTHQELPSSVFMYTRVLFGSSWWSGMEAKVEPNKLGLSNTCKQGKAYAVKSGRGGGIPGYFDAAALKSRCPSGLGSEKPSCNLHRLVKQHAIQVECLAKEF